MHVLTVATCFEKSTASAKVSFNSQDQTKYNDKLKLYQFTIQDIFKLQDLIRNNSVTKCNEEGRSCPRYFDKSSIVQPVTELDNEDGFNFGAVEIKTMKVYAVDRGLFRGIFLPPIF